MPMKPRNNRMSMEEASEVTSNPEQFLTSDGLPEAPRPPQVALTGTPNAEQLRQLLAVLEADEARKLEAEELEAQAPLLDAPAVEALAAEDAELLRSDEEVNEDIDMIVGPFALSHTPEDRHLTMLRLIEDLIASRARNAEYGAADTPPAAT